MFYCNSGFYGIFDINRFQPLSLKPPSSVLVWPPCMPQSIPRNPTIYDELDSLMDAIKSQRTYIHVFIQFVYGSNGWVMFQTMFPMMMMKTMLMLIAMLTRTTMMVVIAICIGSESS